MNIILSGMPGCGKTTVSAVLAEKLGYEAKDTDGVIVNRYGNISQIFANHGEQYFRSLEREAVAELSRSDNAVIATGGGCLMDADNVNSFKSSGKIVYLQTSLKELARRLEGDSSRPLLAGNLMEKLSELQSLRARKYESAADLIINCDGLTPEQIAEKIMELLNLK